MTTAIEAPTTAPARRPAPLVPVAITPRPLADDEVRIVNDLDELTEGNRCSCSAGDDNPY